VNRGLGTGPKTAAGRATILAANTKHGRYKGWRQRRANERYYRRENKREMKDVNEAREASFFAGETIGGLDGALVGIFT